MAAILFLKNKKIKKFFLQILRGQKSKIGYFYKFIPRFSLKKLGKIVFEHSKWGYYNVVCKIYRSEKSAIFEISEKVSQLRCTGKQCGQLSRSPNWEGIVPYDGYHW